MNMDDYTNDSYDTKQTEHYLKWYNNNNLMLPNATNKISSASTDNFDGDLGPTKLSKTNSYSKSSNSKQFTICTRGTTKESLRALVANNASSSTLLLSSNNDIDSKPEQHKREQRQLRLLKQSLSIMYFILIIVKNTRIKLNVSMTPNDVYSEICNGLINNGDKNKRFILIIQHNISPDVSV